jgi:hypothetical protein
MPRDHSVAKEGIIAGLLGGLAVAIWFLIIDAISGQPLYTPSLLGAMLLNVFEVRTQPGVQIGYVAFYSIFHYAAWAAIGVLLTFIVHKADRQPTVLALAFMAFVVITLGSLGYTAILTYFSPLGALAWYNVLIGNALAIAAITTYLWRTHPVLSQAFGRGMGGRE